MNYARHRISRANSGECFRLLLAMMSCGGMFAADANAQTRESSSGQSQAETIKKEIAGEPYSINVGPVRANVGASTSVNYTDNVFYSEDRQSDVMIEPKVSLDALYPVSELNTLRLNLGVSYEWYTQHTSLNAKAPLISPGSELAFNIFVGDVHLRLYDSFSYEESLFFNSFNGNQPFFNFNNVGTFARLDNKVGTEATWDLDKYLLTAGYFHENFKSYSAEFDYLDRQSEWFAASAGYRLGDHLMAGVESRASFNHFDQETTLNDNWRGRVGPFMEATLLEGVTLRGGGGYDWARYDAAGASTSDYDSYYAYARLSQQTRLFTHSLEAGHETVLGDNANNLRNSYVLYAIKSSVIEHVDLSADYSMNLNWAQEYGGPSGFNERFIYYQAGGRVGWQFHRNWRTELGYAYLLKNSDLADRNFQRNRVTVAIIWKF